MATAVPRPTIRWRTVRVDHPSGPCVLGDGGLRRHSRVRARVGDRLAAAATGAPARLRAALASVHRHGGRRSSASPHSRRSARCPYTPGRRVISLGADPSGRLIRWRNRAGHGGGDRQPRVLRSDGDSEGLQVRPVHGLERPSLGQLHQGLHKPIISRDLFARVQDVFAAANHSKHTKRRHAFAGLVTCGRCGCAFTAETKKGQYVYYHCTGHRGPCGNTYVREEELVRQFGEILKQVRIPAELAGKLATVLRESQSDKQKFVRTSMLRLQQQQMLLRSKLDRVYEDRLSDAIPDELWTAKSAELQEELRRVRTEMERHEVASDAYEAAGLQILELAQTAYSSYVAKNPREQARLVKTLVSNTRSIAEVFHRRTLSRSTYWRMEEKLEIGSSGWTRTNNPLVNRRKRWR